MTFRIASLRIGLGRIDPKLAERLTQVLSAPLINAAEGMDFDEANAHAASKAAA